MSRAGSTGEILRQSFAALDETGRAEGGCPDPERIWEAVHANLAPSAARELVGHVAACPSCAADWRIAMRSDRRSAARGLPSRRAVSPARFALLAAAASILLAALLVTATRFGDPAGAMPVYRAGDGSTIESLLPGDLALPRGQALLRWSPLGEDALYSVEVGTLDLVPLASAHDLTESKFLIPPAALKSVADGESIVWQVEASLPDGRRIASDAFVTRVE